MSGCSLQFVAATHGLPKSIDETNRLKDVVANITPAANPSITSSNLSEIRLVNSTGKASASVARPAARLANEPSKMISLLIRNK
jgi:hypothetical protein